jgi:hypothetical protein
LVTTSVVTVAPGNAGNDGAVGLSLDLLLLQATSDAIARLAARLRHTRFIHASPCVTITLSVGNGFPLSPAVTSLSGCAADRRARQMPQIKH